MLIHHLPQATTGLLIAHWSTVTWRGPTVEEREAGQEWLTLTWHKLELLVQWDWTRRALTASPTVVILVHQDVLEQCFPHWLSTLVCVWSGTWIPGRGRPAAFLSYNINTNLNIDDNYVDGVSITYGSAPRKHLWTYAAAQNDNTHYHSFDCPCKQTNTIIAPPFIGTDYYCESGTTSCCASIIYLNDPLWDGQQCGGESLCCTHPNMPWFIKTLNETTTENIELRLCDGGVNYYGTDIPLDLIEILVQ